MNPTAYAASPRYLEASAIDSRPLANVARIFNEAVVHCRPLLQSRQQAVVIESDRMRFVAPIPRKPLAALVAHAISDISSFSRRGAKLSLGALGASIVVRGVNPIDLPEHGLLVEEELRLKAANLLADTRLAWDQGRGPLLTIVLPTARPALRRDRAIETAGLTLIGPPDPLLPAELAPVVATVFGD